MTKYPPLFYVPLGYGEHRGVYAICNNPKEVGVLLGQDITHWGFAHPPTVARPIFQKSRSLLAPQFLFLTTAECS